MDSLRKKVGIIFGGQSAEHEVSIQSARNIVEAMDKDKYEVTEIFIDKNGEWFVNSASVNPFDILKTVEVVFPIVHGTNGEDGALQGLLRMVGVPFVGADVLGSAVGMDKDVMKRLLRDAGIPIGKFVTTRKSDELSYDQAVDKLGVPLFVKPANAGSSVGVHKVKSAEEYASALMDAFKYDTKVLVEEYIKGREIECAVLGNYEPRASLPGEVQASHEFYSYDAKYIDPNGAKIIIPADLSTELVLEVQEIAIKTFQTLECYGLARVDVFVTPENKIIVNEINTLPGFTSISMYPKMWQVSGINYTDLISKLIELALSRLAKLRV